MCLGRDWVGLVLAVIAMHVVNTGSIPIGSAQGEERLAELENVLKSGPETLSGSSG